MITFNIVLLIFLSVATISGALVAVTAKKTAVAILASGAISLFASIFFLVLASPDVAMTEAAIGAGLTTFLFFVILRKTESHHAEK
ncbi:MAG: DUF4040 domain-containing protein [Bacteroidales bacterium]|jgi:uncharacterized MnhB-related membrane protein|nr:DUF4040 domain-containing protein [Bacteroidales bacterium]